MDLDRNQNPNPSFDRLPIDVQSRILSLLPITILVVCKSVSRSWRSLISSPAFIDSYPRNASRRRDDVIFLIWSDIYDAGSVYAYLPSQDRWIHFRLPTLSHRILTGGTSLIFFDYGQDFFFVINPFSPQTPLRRLPSLLRPQRSYQPLALFQDNPSDYKILVVNPSDCLHSQIYDSRTAHWEPCPDLPRHFSSLENAVYLDGLLFCLSRSPTQILTLDPVVGQWAILDLKMPAPSLYCPRILVFRGELYLTGGVKANLQVTRIGIWELDRSTMAWREFGFMPDGYLAEFTANGFQCMSTVHCMGFICFSIGSPKKILTCDIAARRWWWPRPCDMDKNFMIWLGQAIEPYTDILK